MLRFGLDIPTTGEFADILAIAELARAAEAGGWDGLFVYDQIATDPPEPLVDPWIALTAIALATQRIAFGPLVAALPRYRPATVARMTVTLDRVSGGRLILGVGSGSDGADFANLGEERSLARRAGILDEALDVLAGLWSAQTFSFAGEHHRLDDVTFLPPPLQQPRIPIWVAATWPSGAPLRRAARWDGVFAHSAADEGRAMLGPDDVEALVERIRTHRSGSEPFEVAIRNKTPGALDSGDPDVDRYAVAGLTWWLEGVEGAPTYAQMLTLARRGPPVGTTSRRTS